MKSLANILAHDSAQACALLMALFGACGIAELFCTLMGVAAK